MKNVNQTVVVYVVFWVIAAIFLYVLSQVG